MGFYGKINNTSTSLVFDEIYPNRVEMETKAENDNVFIGRYVLVNYDKPDDKGISHYEENEAVDRVKWPTGRLFDSTVWQKVYTNSEIKYVMVAELNSIAPSMSIVVDAPTPIPMPPHFDVVESQTTSYKLHVQPSWGFKIKKAESQEVSDFQVNAKTVKWDDGAGTIISENLNYPGDIFFNKKAFSSDYHYNDLPSGDNKIEVKFEASGRDYYGKHSDGEEDQNDTYALSINLPSIGQAIATMWDYIYGEGEQIDENCYKRFTDIGWEIDGGPRLVDTLGYDKKGADSIAGSINSVHDLMGKIIVDDNPETPLEDALVNRIYYRNGKYWRKAETPKFEAQSVEDKPISNMRDFNNDYYYKVNNNYYLEQEGYQNGNTYYSLSDIEGPITFYGTKWEPNKYYKDYNENDLNGYQLDSSTDPDNTINYYDIKGVTSNTVTKVNNNRSAEALCFYPGDYYSEDPDSIYQKLFPTVKLTEESGIEEKGKGLFYLSKEDAGGRTGYLPFNGSIKYEDIPKGDNGVPILKYFENYEIELAGTDTLFITYDFNKATSTEIKTIVFEKDKYYYQIGDKWLKLNNAADIDLTQTYYPIEELGLTIIKLDEPFYEPNTYYYLNGVDYILAIDEEQRPNTQYYKINQIEQLGEDITIYEPNKYYYKDENGKMVLDTSPTVTPGRVYYTDIYTLYVRNDPSGQYPIGYKWNPEVAVPDIEGFELGYKIDGHEWKELIGFSRTLNTIHGLILRINQIINFNNAETRDTTTVQGCINQLNDIINLFDKLKPGNILIVNNAGKITSEPLVNTKLVGYSMTENDDEDIVLASDTLGEGLNKLQSQIIQEQKVRSEDKTEILAALAQEIANTNKAIDDAIDQEVVNRDNAIARESALHEQAIATEKSEREAADNGLKIAIETEVKNREDAINALEFKFTEPVGIGAVITSIAQDAGQISATEKKIGELTLSGYELKNNIVHIAYTDTINEAFSKVQSQIDNLYTRNDGINKEVKENYLRKEEFNTIESEIKTDIGVLEELIENLGETVNNHGKSIGDIETSVEAQEKDIELLFARNDGINKEVKDNYVRKEDLNSIIQGLLETINKLEERITELENQLNN